MKRWVWLGLVGLMACHDEAPSPPPESPSNEMPRPAQRCPFVGQDTALPPRRMSTPVEEAPLDGREPVLVRFRPGATRSATGTPRPLRAAVERVGGHVRHEWPRLHALAARLRPEER
ncbi:MAG TPA: hypothetical protein VF664_04090, partial [Cystobacter sp.]